MTDQLAFNIVVQTHPMPRTALIVISTLHNVSERERNYTSLEQNGKKTTPVFSLGHEVHDVIRISCSDWFLMGQNKGWPS